MGNDRYFSNFKRIRRLACIVTVFGVLQFFILTFLAAFLYPGGYDYFGYYFSDLGAVAARNGDPNLFSRILCKILGKIGSILGVVSSPFLIAVALFPLDTQLNSHFLATLVFVLLFVSATLLYSISMILNQNYPKHFGVIGFILFVIPIASFTVSFIDPFAPLGAFLQKIALYCYFIWILLPIYLVWPLVRSRS